MHDVVPDAADRRRFGLLAGQPDRARRAYRAVIAEAERTGRPTARAVAARCRGLLAETYAAGQLAYPEALQHHKGTTRPFDEARTQLCFAEFLRRNRRDGQAREHVDAALVTFVQLGSKAWIRRATGAPPQAAVDASAALTRRELEVAREVAKGRTDAEVASALGITSKTVGYHLGHVYQKLGVRGRGEMSAVIRDLPPEPSG